MWCFCIIIFGAFPFLPAFLCSYPRDWGDPVCFFCPIIQRHPVEIALWAVLVYTLCKLFYLLLFVMSVL
jgi:hypothetical protein